MFRIRFHGRGGQGMKTAGNILGSAFFGEGFEVQDAPRYGAERRGAPLFSYVRASRTPIQERGVIDNPDLVVVADESLMMLPAAGVMQGVTADTVILINTRDAQGWQARARFPGVVLAVPAIAASPPGGTPPLQSAVCAGAAARLVGVIRRETLAQAVRLELDARGRLMLDQDLRWTLAAYDAMSAHAGCVRERVAERNGVTAAPDWIDVPQDSVRRAAPDIHATASSEQSLTGTWRSFRPVIDPGHCNRCSWICGTLCPDSAIRVDADRTPHIDYDHCKGCLVCVAVCPPHAIRAVAEGKAAACEKIAQ